MKIFMKPVHPAKRHIAYRNLLRLHPVKVDKPIAEVIAEGRQRGIRNVKSEMSH